MEISVFGALLHLFWVRSRNGIRIAYSIAFVIGVAACVLLSMMRHAPPGQLDVLMPPDEFIHPFNGRVAEMYLPHRRASPMLSLSHHGESVWAMWLPRVGDPDIDEALYQCLTVIEVANCNGATDINTPAVKARTAAAEQARYNRRCSQGYWRWAYEKIQLRAAEVRHV